ncbi:MAG: response regulator [Deltaproteobacteria bacterium]
MIEILLVDDSITVRMELGDALATAGFTPLRAATLAEARELLRTRDVALAILDVGLPDGDGIDFLHELRADPRHATLPVLMLSSEAEVADRIRGLEHGANGYVGKPYDVGFVTARIRQLVAPGRATKALVLVVDGSITCREALSAHLVHAGYEVVTAATGADALRLAAARRPAAIIVDRVMPDMGGDVVIRRVRLDPTVRTTSCLLLTGSDDAAAEIAALDAGADAFARKESAVDIVIARLAAMLRSAAETAREPQSSLGPKRVLVVDDSEDYLEGLAGVLQDDGYDVVQASSGAQAIELLAVEAVDCVVLDTVMPGLSGIETCKRIKHAPSLRDTPLILMTSRDGRDVILEAFAEGADDFVSKNLGVDVVAARVKAQIRRKRFSDEHRHVRERLLRSETEASEARAARQLAETRAALAEQLARTNFELAATNRQLAAANRELEAFSYSVSHDLRSPLRAIRSFTQMLEEDAAPKLDETSRDHLRRVIAATTRMSDLIDALLELSRISRVAIQRAPVDLGAIAAAVIDELRHRDPDRNIELAIAPQLVASADARLARALLDNLIGNAWKFTAHTTGARIEIGVRPAEAEGGERTYFVRDNGAGFDMAHAAKLFAPFQRLHGTDFAGTGVGLATVRRIVERHGGRIWAESAVGSGATFWFTLPN